jgi:hypothetical protein
MGSSADPFGGSGSVLHEVLNALDAGLPFVWVSDGQDMTAVLASSEGEAVAQVVEHARVMIPELAS